MIWQRIQTELPKSFPPSPMLTEINSFSFAEKLTLTWWFESLRSYKIKVQNYFENAHNSAGWIPHKLHLNQIFDTNNI